MQPGVGQHQIIPKEATGSGSKVAIPANKRSSAPGDKIAPEHPFWNVSGADTFRIDQSGCSLSDFSQVLYYVVMATSGFFIPCQYVEHPWHDACSI